MYNDDIRKLPSVILKHCWKPSEATGWPSIICSKNAFVVIETDTKSLSLGFDDTFDAYFNDKWKRTET